MGLDMYLSAKRYYWNRDEKPKVADVPEGYEVKEITVGAAYWRKASMIHKWFVDNVQNGEDECRPHSLDHEMLKKLRDLCADLLTRKEPQEAIVKLPTTSGFFFGSTDYDAEGYWADLTDTVEQIDKALAAFPLDDKGRSSWDFEYRSSW
jgi:hypothetical protein